MPGDGLRHGRLALSKQGAVDEKYSGRYKTYMTRCIMHSLLSYMTRWGGDEELGANRRGEKWRYHVPR